MTENFETRKLALIQDNYDMWTEQGFSYNDVEIFANALLKLAASDAAAPSEWQPIESAPKNGTPILAYEHGLEMRVVSRKDGIWISYDGHDFAPSHWKPLPDPPTGAPR